MKPQAREGFLSSRTRSISAKQIKFHGRWQATHTLEQWLALRWPCAVMQGAGTWMKWDVEWQEGTSKSFGLLGIGEPQGQGLTHPFSRHLACREGKLSQIWAIYPCGKPLFQLWGKSNIIYPSLLMLPAAAASPAVVGKHFGSTCSVKQLQEIPSFLLPASQA